MALKKRSVIIKNVKTSITLENEYWDKLAEIAEHDGTSRPKLIDRVHENRDEKTSLSSALRLFVLSESNRIAREKVDVSQG